MEEEEEVEVEVREEDEEELEIFEDEINGKTFYVTSMTNGDIYSAEDEECENPIGTISNGKAIFF